RESLELLSVWVHPESSDQASMSARTGAPQNRTSAAGRNRHGRRRPGQVVTSSTPSSRECQGSTETAVKDQPKPNGQASAEVIRHLSRAGGARTRDQRIHNPHIP